MDFFQPREENSHAYFFGAKGDYHFLHSQSAKVADARVPRSLDLNPGGISYVGATFAGAKGDYRKGDIRQMWTDSERVEDFSRLMLTQLATLGHTAQQCNGLHRFQGIFPLVLLAAN